MANLLIDIFAGSLASCINTLVGYPLDFLKTRLQISHSNLGTLAQAKAIIKSEGFLALYSGMSAQLTNSLMSGAFYYTTYEFVRRKFTQIGNKGEHDFIPKYQTFIAGSCAGTASNLFNVPFEYVKILAQKDSKLKEGPFHKMFIIAKEEGVLQLYKGCRIQMFRDSIGCGLYFLGHATMLEQFTPEGQARNQASEFGIFVASITAGASYWAVSYPIDIVKTRVQTTKMSINEAIQQIYKERGILNFYKGYKVCMMRSVLVNIFALQSYEHIRRTAYFYM